MSGYVNPFRVLRGVFKGGLNEAMHLVFSCDSWIIFNRNQKNDPRITRTNTNTRNRNAKWVCCLLSAVCRLLLRIAATLVESIEGHGPRAFCVG